MPRQQCKPLHAFVSELSHTHNQTQHAGYFRLNRTHSAEMFFFYYASRSARRSDPVVLWMTGGPGCSSEIAIFYGGCSALRCVLLSKQQMYLCCRIDPAVPWMTGGPDCSSEIAIVYGGCRHPAAYSLPSSMQQVPAHAPRRCSTCPIASGNPRCTQSQRTAPTACRTT